MRVRSLLALLLLLASVPPGTAAVRFAGDGTAPQERSVCLTDADYARAQFEVDRNLAWLEAEGRLPRVQGKRLLLGFPLRAAEHLEDPGFHQAVSFVDHHQAFGALQDYECGQRTADGTSVGWHRGTDYNIWPFPWQKMRDDEVEIVAAAPGIITAHFEGNLDTSCPGAVVGPGWNGVIVRHDEDGSIAWYVHMKRGSVTRKGVGAHVQAGEVLGVVGSSGPSIIPHLHFEVRNVNNVVRDPYQGPCNGLNQNTWWQEQPEYWEPAILKVSTHHKRVDWGTCPEVEQTYLRDTFGPGETVTMAAFLRHVGLWETVSMELERPDGSLVDGWEHVVPGGRRRGWFVYYEWPVPESAPAGEYVYRVAYGEESVEHRFQVEASTPVADTDPGSPPAPLAVWRLDQNRPNPFNPSTRIGFSVAEAGPVELAVYDLRGARVRTLRERWTPTGDHHAVWDGRDDLGRPVVSGTYFYRLRTSQRELTRRMVLLQ